MCHVRLWHVASHPGRATARSRGRCRHSQVAREGPCYLLVTDCLSLPHRSQQHRHTNHAPASGCGSGAPLACGPFHYLSRHAGAHLVPDTASCTSTYRTWSCTPHIRHNPVRTWALPTSFQAVSAAASLASNVYTQVIGMLIGSQRCLPTTTCPSARVQGPPSA